MKWIECNLPWFATVDQDPRPDLSEEIQEVFGVHPEEVHRRWFSNGGFNEMLEVVDSLDYQDLSEEKERLLAREWAARGPTQEKRARAWLLSQEIDRWEENHPKMKAWRVKEAEKKEPPSFVGKGLNKPGTRIQLEDGRILWLGDISCAGGVCNDCMIFDDDTIIVRYRREPE